MDYRRVAEIYDPRRGVGGTGYLIGSRFILTAHHVIADLGQPGRIGATYDIRLIGDYEAGQKDWLESSGKLCWDAHDTKVDLALIELNREYSSQNVSDTPTRFGRMVTDEVDAAGYGFPIVQLIEKRANLEPLKGLLNRIAGIKENQLRLQVTSPIPNKASEWGGISGTALFADNRLVGVVIETKNGFAEKTLWVVPITLATSDEDFCSLVCDSSPNCIDRIDNVPLGDSLELITPQQMTSSRGNVEPGSANWLNYSSLQSELIGREGEIKSLEGFYNNKESKFLWWIIVGDGGVGKSRLVLESLLRMHIPAHPGQ